MIAKLRKLWPGRRVVGGLMLTLGITLNPWVVAILMTSDGQIASPQKVFAVFSFNTIAVLAGLSLLTPPRLRGRVMTLAFLTIYGAFYLGWLLHRPHGDDVAFGYTSSDIALFVTLAVPFVLPVVLSAALKKLGPKGLLYSVLPLATLLAATYVGGGLYYYHTRQYRLDPFLQPSQPRRPVEADLPDSAGLLRVLALGGSTTRSGYPVKLDSYLLGGLGRPVQVLNAGMNWYTSKHSLTAYTTYYNAWKPHVVVIMHAVNDLIRSCTPTAYTTGPYNDRWTHFLGPAIRSAKPPTFEAWVSHQLIPDYGDFRNATEMWFARVRYREREYGLQHYRSVGPFSRHLERLVRYAQADGAHVVLVTQPSLYGATGPEAERKPLWFGLRFCSSNENYFKREYPSSTSLMAAMRLFNDVVRCTAGSTDATLVDAAAVLDGQVEAFVDDVHYTDWGLAMMRNMVGSKLVSMLRGRNEGLHPAGPASDSGFVVGRGQGGSSCAEL